MTLIRPLLEAKDLRRYFVLPSHRIIKAVDGVSFVLEEGECFGLIGESACGKTTLGKLLVRLHIPQDGMVFFQGKNIYGLKKKESRLYQKKVQMIFQNPETSLNPRFTVERALRDPLQIHGYAPGRIKERVNELLELVGLDKSKRRFFPHELSGGQRQRLSVARALALEPELLIADEPFTAQDTRNLRHIASLLLELAKKRNLTLLLIAHDLTLVREFCKRIAVMYAGRLVEIAPASELYTAPYHPYTKTLLEAAASRAGEKVALPFPGWEAEPFNPFNPPAGCPFNPRCPWADAVCRRESPELVRISRDHFVACHFPRQSRA